MTFANTVCRKPDQRTKQIVSTRKLLNLTFGFRHNTWMCFPPEILALNHARTFYVFCWITFIPNLPETKMMQRHAYETSQSSQGLPKNLPTVLLQVPLIIIGHLVQDQLQHDMAQVKSQRKTCLTWFQFSWTQCCISKVKFEVQIYLRWFNWFLSTNTSMNTSIDIQFINRVDYFLTAWEPTDSRYCTFI